ncbi:MAG: hypothetical protein ACK5LY_01635 [Lachnospirales bacterium]
MLRKIIIINSAFLVVNFFIFLYCLIYMLFDFSSTLKFAIDIKNTFDMSIKTLIALILVLVLNLFLYVRNIRKGAY